jgi:predicted permease
MNQMLSGAIVVASLMAGLFFLRFWRHTRDRFFLYFALSFFLEASNRLALTVLTHAKEDNPLFYTLRVLAYGLIVAAIWQKNRKRP